MTDPDPLGMPEPTDAPALYGAPEAEPSASETPETEPPPAVGAPPPGRRTLLLVAVVIVVAGIVVVAALFVSGVGPFARSGTPAPGANDVTSGQTFSEVAATAAHAAAHFGPGPWMTLLAAGADPSVPILESTALPANEYAGVSSLSCAGRAEATDAAVSFAGFDGDLTLGQAPSWLVVEMNATGTMLFEFVLGGNATPVELYTGPGCTVFELLGTLPNWTIDSSQAVAAAMAAGGTSFIRAHPGGSTTFAAADLGGAGDWQVTYSTCPPVGNATASQTYYAFQANVTLDTGVVNGTPLAGPTTCHGLDLTGPIANAAGHASSGRLIQSWGPPFERFVGIASGLLENHSANYAYTIEVNTSTGTLHWSDLLFTVRNASGQVPRGPFAVDIYAATGCTLATGALDDGIYVGNIFGIPGLGYCTSGVTGGDALVAAGQTVSVLSSLNLTGAGDSFEVYGASSYSGNETWPIP